MKKRIFHKVLIPALVVMLMTPFCITTVKADATNQQILDMLTSIRSQVVYILQTQRIGSTGNYDTIDYLQKMDTNLLELDTHLTEIMADMTAAWDQTDPIQTDNYFESILNYFKAFYDGIGSSSTHLYYIRGNTASMVTALNNISSDLDHISAKIDELVTLVSNIDNSIDTISWQENAYYKGVTNNFTDYNTSTGTFNNTYYAVVGNNITNYQIANNMIHIRVSYSPIYLSDPQVIMIDQNNNTYDVTRFVLYSNFNRNYIDIYLVITDYSYGNLRYSFGVKYNENARVSSTGTDVNLVGLLPTEDIEYWQLLNYFNQFKNWNILLGHQETIINKLDTVINGNASSDTVVNQNNNLNEQLQTSVTQYDQVENQFKESFSTSMNQISKPDLSNIVSAAAWYTTQLTSLFNASGSFQIIYVLPLVLGIALFFIGRGAVAFRQSSNQETKWVETIKDENGFTTRHGTIRSETVRGKGRYK